MAENKTRLTIRLPDEALKELRDELDSCYTDAARFQFVVQFYLDYKALGGVPQPLHSVARSDTETPSDSRATAPERSHARTRHSEENSIPNPPASDDTPGDTSSTDQ